MHFGSYSSESQMVETEVALMGKPTSFIWPHFVLAQTPGSWVGPLSTQKHHRVSQAGRYDGLERQDHGCL